MSNISISTAVESDLEDVGAAFDAYRQFYRQPLDLGGAKQFIGDRLTDKSSHILIARNASGALMGFTQLYPSFSSVGMKPIWILNDLFVYPSYRRQGVARALMHTARDRAIAAGITAITLATELTNDPAQSLYRSLGYVPDRQFLHYRLALR